MAAQVWTWRNSTLYPGVQADEDYLVGPNPGLEGVGMLGWRHACAMIMAALTLSAAAASAVQVQGEIIHIGFSGNTSSSGQDQGLDRYRIGSWIPIAVELVNLGGEQTELTLEARQQDQDGDEILARRTVWPQSKQRYFLYLPAGREQAPQYFTVRVYDSKGQYAKLVGPTGADITELRPPPVLQPIPSDHQVILDISQKPLAPLRNLMKEDEKLVRPLVVLRGVAKDLPDDVAGLDMADVIVWDAADPSLMDLEPRNALVEWVRRGGTLVLGVSRTWDLVAKGKFGEMLPVVPTRMAAMSTPPEYLTELLSIDAFDAKSFTPALSYCPIAVKDLASGTQILVPGPLTNADRAETTAAKDDAAFVTRRPFGRGQVIFVAAELSDLLSRGSRPSERVLADLIGVRLLKGDPPDQSRVGGLRVETDIFNTLRRKTTFGVTAGLYLGFAFLFVVAYILLATGGTWAWLKRQQRVQHTWTAFAMVSIAASVVSVASVQWMRGISYRVQELSIVDGEAGSNQAHAACYFGLKAPVHSRLDLRVPCNWLDPGSPTDINGLLAPLAPEREGTVFASRERYQAVAGLGELQGVPMRATLKQFEAEWEGQLSGRLEAGLRREQAGTVRLGTDSWVKNGLGTELRSCYLFVAGSDVPQARVTRDLQIRVYGLEKLSADARASLGDFRDLGVLQANQGGWLRSLGMQVSAYGGRVDQEQDRKEITQEGFEAALLLMSLYDEFDQNETRKSGFDLTRSRGHELDRSAHLRQNTALFVGFSRDPGPARLCYREAGTKQKWAALQPTQADVVYRMAVPVMEPQN